MTKIIEMCVTNETNVAEYVSEERKKILIFYSDIIVYIVFRHRIFTYTQHRFNIRIDCNKN